MAAARLPERSGKAACTASPDGLELHTAMCRDGRTRERKVALDGRRHCRTIALPQRGTPFDVGEEERDSAGGKFGHDPLQTLGWTWCGPIVARECCAHAAGSPMLHSHDPA